MLKIISKIMKIGICNDHAGVQWKHDIIKVLTQKGYQMVNFGTDSTESFDYPDSAHPMASALERGEIDLGIAICGTGNGMAITLNKHNGVRAGLAWTTEIAALVKEHNNANILVIPARFIPMEEALAIIDTWLSSEFQGGRHLRRINKIPLA